MRLFCWTMFHDHLDLKEVGFLKLFLAAVLACILSGMGHAASNFSMEYAMLSCGGGASSSAHFGMVTMVTPDGATGEVQTSANFSLSSVLASPSPEGPSAIADWMLYE